MKKDVQEYLINRLKGDIRMFFEMQYVPSSALGELNHEFTESLTQDQTAQLMQLLDALQL
jgi:hypothetical protein